MKSSWAPTNRILHEPLTLFYLFKNDMHGVALNYRPTVMAYKLESIHRQFAHIQKCILVQGQQPGPSTQLRSIFNWVEGPGYRPNPGKMRNVKYPKVGSNKIYENQGDFPNYQLFLEK